MPRLVTNGGDCKLQGQCLVLYDTADNDWLSAADNPLRNPTCCRAAAKKKQYGAHWVPCAEVAWLGSHGALYRVHEKKSFPPEQRSFFPTFFPSQSFHASSSRID
jgi:hypothetical protein